MTRRSLLSPRDRIRSALCVAGMVAAVATGWVLIWQTRAHPHEVRTLDGKPLGFNWPGECCGGQDCAFIDASAVVERADGYHVTLRPGDHPMLKTKGYSAIIPYGSERTSPTGDYAICLSREGANRYCFFAGGRLG